MNNLSRISNQNNYQQVEVQNEFNNFLDLSILKWAESTYKKIKREVQKLRSCEDITVKKVIKKHKVSNYTAKNVLLANKLRDLDIEFRDGGMNMYWSGELKLSFVAKTSYYSKNTLHYKEYFLEVSLSSIIKNFVEKVGYLCREDGISISVIVDVFDGSGLRKNLTFDALDKKFTFTSDSDFVLKLNGIYLTYKIKL